MTNIEPGYNLNPKVMSNDLLKCVDTQKKVSCVFNSNGECKTPFGADDKKDIAYWNMEYEGEAYQPLEDEKLVYTNPINGQKKYERTEEYENGADKTIKVKEYVVTDSCNRVIEEKNAITIGENEQYHGYIITKGNKRAYYDVNNKKVGTTETDANGKTKVMDKTGKTLYYLESRIDNHLGYDTEVYYTPDNKIYLTAEPIDMDGKTKITIHEKNGAITQKNGWLNFANTRDVLDMFQDLDKTINDGYIFQE